MTMLEKETKIFESKLPEFVENNLNEFVVIKGEEVGFFANKLDAVNYGMRTYGPTGCFLVRQVAEKQPEISMPALTLGLLQSK